METKQSKELCMCLPCQKRRINQYNTKVKLGLVSGEIKERPKERAVKGCPCKACERRRLIHSGIIIPRKYNPVSDEEIDRRAIIGKKYPLESFREFTPPLKTGSSWDAFGERMQILIS